MFNAVNTLIIEISDSLKNFTDMTISYDEASLEYDRLAEKYEKAIYGIKRIYAKDIDGFCYYCNTENFSLLTGVYKINDGITSLAYYGEENLNTRIMNAIQKNKDKLKENILFEISIQENKELLQNVFIYLFMSGSGDLTLLASVSSSLFFSKDKFLFSGKLVKNLLNFHSDESRLIEKNYFSEISEEMNKYFKNNINGQFMVRITLFVFSIIEKVFNHSGINAIFDASDYILQSLKNNHKNDSRCFALSVRDYIVFEKINRKDADKANRQKQEFAYNNINMPYQTLKLDIVGNESVNNVWDKIMLFENYLSTGDIIK